MLFHRRVIRLLTLLQCGGGAVAGGGAGSNGGAVAAVAGGGGAAVAALSHNNLFTEVKNNARMPLLAIEILVHCVHRLIFHTKLA